MKSCVLASGSSGNVFLIEDSNKNIYLIDIGISFKKLEKLLLEKQILISQISGVFLTHEHIDHIGGLEIFMKNSSCPIYLTKGTYNALNFNLIDNKRFILVKENQILKLDDVKVFVIGKSHDALEPVSYVFENGIKIGIFTDLGLVTPKLIAILKNLDVIYFEANFCENFIKDNKNFNIEYVSRLYSNVGHLSVQDSIYSIKNFVRENQKIILCHISENTNFYENVYSLVKNCINELNVDCEIFISFQNEASDWIE